MSLLSRFTDGSFAIEAAPARAALALAAALAFAVPAHGAPARPTSAPNADPREAGYADALRTAQAGLDAWLGAGKAIVLDRSAPRAAETDRIAKRLRAAGGEIPETPCIVVGADPKEGPAEILSPGEGLPKAAPGDISYRDAHLYALWRGAGCAGALRPEEAAAMAIVVAGRDGTSRDLPGVAAAAIEAREWTAPIGASLATTVTAAARQVHHLRARGQLAGKGYAELAAVARDSASFRGGPGPNTLSNSGLARAAKQESFYVPTREGAVAVDWRDWLRLSNIPEARRLGALLDHVDGTRRGPEPLKAYASRYHEGDRATADARRGDTGALAYYPLDLAEDFIAKGKMKVAELGPLPSWDGMPGIRIPFDRATEELKPLARGAAFKVVARKDGHEVARGEAITGIAQPYAFRR